MRVGAYGVSTLSQVAGIAALERADHWLARFLAHLQRQRDHAVARLNRMDGVRCHLPEGTYVVFPDVSALGIEVEEIAETLRQHHGVRRGARVTGLLRPGCPRAPPPSASRRRGRSSTKGSTGSRGGSTRYEAACALTPDATKSVACGSSFLIRFPFERNDPVERDQVVERQGAKTC